MKVRATQQLELTQTQTDRAINRDLTMQAFITLALHVCDAAQWQEMAIYGLDTE